MNRYRSRIRAITIPFSAWRAVEISPSQISAWQRFYAIWPRVTVEGGKHSGALFRRKLYGKWIYRLPTAMEAKQEFDDFAW